MGVSTRGEGLLEVTVTCNERTDIDNVSAFPGLEMNGCIYYGSFRPNAAARDAICQTTAALKQRWRGIQTARTAQHILPSLAAPRANFTMTEMKCPNSIIVKRWLAAVPPNINLIHFAAACDQTSPSNHLALVPIHPNSPHGTRGPTLSSVLLIPAINR